MKALNVLHIKYMVSLRCKLLVKDELKKMGIAYTVINLGAVTLSKSIKPVQRAALKSVLLRSGLELMDDSKAILIEKVKNIITEMVHSEDEWPKMNFSAFLAKKMKCDYTSLAHTFSEVNGTTIEHFIIANKIERAKELLLYDELSLTQISYLLNYSSVAHLSNQFKKVTGLTPTYFKNLKQHRLRFSLDKI
jgi:AraC-like DNA-binding protein